MNVTLTPELEQFVQTQIDSGKYASATEVLLAGVALLKEIDRVYKGRFEELRQTVLDGVDAADRGDVIDSETVFENLQAKLEHKRYQGQ